MKKHVVILFLLVLLFACKQNNKQIDEQQLLGIWETVDGFDFEEITFSVEDENKVVSLVFDQRANMGKWKIQNGNLVIESPYDTISYNEVQFLADTLILVQPNGANSIFIKKEEKHCDAKEMLQSLKDISKVEFSEIADTLLDNKVEAYYMYIPIEVKEDFSVLGKAISPLVDELPNAGFELDNELITEIQTGYFFKSYRLIVTNQFITPFPNSNKKQQDEDNTSGVYEAIIICYCQ
ncbi:MAG: hypothetical protein AB7S48_06655 [Bacteroidales bacterium]